MVGAQDGGVPCEVVKVVHDNRHKQVDHNEAAEEYEGDEVEISGVAAAGLVWVEEPAGGLVPGVALLVARPPALAGQHDVRPGLASRTSELSGLENSSLQYFLYLRPVMKEIQIISVIAWHSILRLLQQIQTSL